MYDPNRPGPPNRTPRMVLLLAAFLLGSVMITTPLELEDILRSGSPDQVRRAVGSRRIHLTTGDAYGWTALMIAAANNPEPEVVETLIELGARLEARSLDDWTPLMFAAAFNGNPAVIESLISRSADPEKRTRDAWTPMLSASRFTGDRIVNRSIETAPVGQSREHGWTALFFAARFNPNPAVVQALINAGSSPESQDEYGRTPLQYAARYSKSTGVLDAMISAGADPDHIDLKGTSAREYLRSNSELAQYRFP